MMSKRLFLHFNFWCHASLCVLLLLPESPRRFQCYTQAGSAAVDVIISAKGEKLPIETGTRDVLSGVRGLRWLLRSQIF